MQEKEIDFFKSSGEKIQQTIHKIDKKPFLKIAFLTIALGCAIGLGISISTTVIHYYTHSQQVKIEHQKNSLDINIEQIKKINPEEFADFIHYLKNNENIYNDLSYLTINSLLQAEKANYENSSDASDRNKDISNQLTSYKKEIENIINMSNEVYNNVQQNNLTKIQYDHTESFLNYYRNYNAGIYTRNKDIEEIIHNSLYNVKRVNKETNLTNHVYEQVKDLEKIIDVGYNKNTSNNNNNIRNKP